MTVQAIYENGVFRPVKPVDLPENARVEFDPRIIVEDQGQATEFTEKQAKAIHGIYRIMSERYNSGIHDTAERHNEHQP